MKRIKEIYLYLDLPKEIVNLKMKSSLNRANWLISPVIPPRKNRNPNCPRIAQHLVPQTGTDIPPGTLPPTPPVENDDPNATEGNLSLLGPPLLYTIPVPVLGFGFTSTTFGTLVTDFTPTDTGAGARS